MSGETITKELLDSYITRLADKIDSQSKTFDLRMTSMQENFDLKLDNLHLKVDQTLEQATKTNGRVTALETKPHPIANCPQAKMIEGLKTDVETIKTERKFVAKMAAFVAAGVTAVVSILKFFF